jgi:hypothetical protein
MLMVPRPALPSRFAPWVRPRCWPCHLSLTCIGAVFAMSGAADIASAIAMIGTGVVLDVIRWMLLSRRLTQAYWTEEIAKTSSDQSYVIKARARDRWCLISIVVTFLCHALLWVFLAPDEGRANMSLLTYFNPEPHAILRLSHIARSYSCDLTAHGYPERARLWEVFVCQSFAIYIVSVLIGTFWWSKTATVLTLIRWNEAASERATKVKSLSAAIALCGAISVIGFFVVNNLVGIDWSGQHAGTALSKSNISFMTYSIQMLFSCLLALFVQLYSVPYCLGPEKLPITISEG